MPFKEIQAKNLLIGNVFKTHALGEEVEVKSLTIGKNVVWVNTDQENAKCITPKYKVLLRIPTTSQSPMCECGRFPIRKETGICWPCQHG